MNLQTFIQSQTDRMKAFEAYWNTKVAPTLEQEDRDFWETSASVWECLPWTNGAVYHPHC